MKNFIPSLLFMLIPLFGSAQCPTSNIVLNTQADIDNFAVNYPNCTVLTHELRIDGDASNISNLNGLSAIISAQNIFILNTQIVNFSGLENMENIAHLALWFNVNLVNFVGFNSLQSMGFLEVFINPGLTSLDGMISLSSLENISLFQNTSLNNISQLSFVETLNNVEIWDNGLNNLSGLENLHTIDGYLKISDEPLNNFDELSNLSTINGSLYLIDNPQAVNVSAFSNLSSLENLYIIGCHNLTDLNGFGGIQTITGTLRIGNNSGLIDLSPLNDITSVEYLDVYENENLLSLNGIENLSVIGQRLLIDRNESLLSIGALSNVSSSLVNEVVIINNTALSFCNNEFICAVISDPTVSKSIFSNDSGCNSIEEIEASCILSVDGLTLETSIQIFPNPTSDLLFINVSNDTRFESATVYSVLGERLLINYESKINFSSFSQGVYFILISTSKGNITKKIIKE